MEVLTIGYTYPEVKNMKKILFIFPFLILTAFIMENHLIYAEEPTIKVLEIKTNNLIAEAKASPDFDKHGEKAIKSIKNVTVEANPVPNKGILIRLSFTKPLKVKNKWFNDIVNEVILIYETKSKKNGKIVLYTDENTPMFFDIEYDLTALSIELDIE